MRMKQGLLALSVAAALGTTGAFAQDTEQAQRDLQESPAAPTDETTTLGPTPGGTSLPDPTAESTDTASAADSMSGSSSEMEQMEQSASADASISDDQHARAGAPLSSPSASAAESSDYTTQAQSDVPPPVDSETVRRIQQALSDRGYEVQVDGIWGPETRQALMEFQSEQNMQASGQLDSETFAALEQEAGTQTASAAGQTSSD